MEIKKTILQGGKYQIEKIIGQNIFNKVYLGNICKSNEKIIIKEFSYDYSSNKSLTDKLKRDFIRTSNLLRRLDHRYIVKCLDVFEENCTVYYVTEFSSGVCLRDYLEQSTRFDITLRISEQRSISIIKLIAEALDYLHKRDICHLDVNPSNIIYHHIHNEGYDAIEETDSIILLDFASATSFKDSLSYEDIEFSSDPRSAGTPGYAPLELSSHSKKISPATDIYSLGATWYFLLTGQRPPSATDLLENGGIEDIPEASEKVNRAISAAMNPVMKRRPQSITEFLALFGEELAEPSSQDQIPEFEVEIETEKKSQQVLAVGTELTGTSYTYVIQQILGQGGFGITYLASVKLKGLLGTLNSDIKVAIKEFFMKDYCSRDDNGTVTFSDNSKGSMSLRYAKKFVKEAIHLSKLNHPNIVKVVESFEHNNTSYYVMEYLEGKSLDDHVIDKLGLSEYEAITFIRQIGSALSYMHSHELLHMDVKPKNVMLKDNQCILIDFGLAKQYDEQGQPESSTGLGAGTPGYAPLEQINYNGDKGFAPTIDVYALGATLYKLLTAKTPPPASVILNDGFDKKELEDIDVSKDTIDVISMAMEPRKKDRIQSIDEFLRMLPSEDNIKIRIKKKQTSEGTFVEDNERSAHHLNFEKINGIPVYWNSKATDYQRIAIRNLLKRLKKLHDGKYVLINDFISEEEFSILNTKATLPIPPTQTTYRTKDQIFEFIKILISLTQNRGFTLMDINHFYNCDYTFADETEDILMSKEDTSFFALSNSENQHGILTKVCGHKWSNSPFDETKDKDDRFRFKIMIDSSLFNMLD